MADETIEMTAGQKSILSECLENAKTEGLSTERADFDVSKDAINELIRIADRPTTNRGWEFVKSPKEAVDMLEGLGVTRSEAAQTWFWGSFDAHWVWYYEFYRRIGLELTPEEERWLEAMKTVVANSGWFWVFDKLAIVADRPTEIHLNEQGEPHAFQGPALSWPDKWGIYAIDNVRMPKWVCETEAERMPAKRVLAIKNAEQRHRAIKKCGIEPLISQCPNQTLDTQIYETPELDHHTGEPTGKIQDHKYEILEVILDDVRNGGITRWLKMFNPSVANLVHLEGIPPDVSTVHGALAFRAGKPEAEYVFPKFLT